MLKIYHNKMCGKSRQALALISNRDEPIEVIEYLKTAPTPDELREVISKLQIHPEQLVRKNEKVYKEQFAGKQYTEEEWLQILSQNPILIERPIVVKGDKAVIGRPPEKVLDIL